MTEANQTSRPVVGRLEPSVRPWEQCREHGPAQPRVWACPNCLVQLREDNERMRAALAELLACHTESAGWSMSMLADRAEFDAMLQRSQERLEAAVGAARAALGA